jgi:SAM-dependent methyltransferase
MHYNVPLKRFKSFNLTPIFLFSCSHYTFYLKDGMSLLELGAAEKSYLPKDLKLSRHIGVGGNKERMEQNPSLTESFVADLNKVKEEIGIDSADIEGLEPESFDAIIMANTIDFLTSPREVFKSAWRLLKPGGLMMVPFTNSDAYTDKFGRAQTKMWMDMNDDQHMWVCGTFFQFSASDGWKNLIGFDISPEGAKKQDENAILSKLSGKKVMNMYVVQANKVAPDESIDLEDPEKSFRSKMWLLPKLEDRDKKLLAPRLARAYSLVKSREEQDALEQNVDTLPKIYECLLKMDQFAFPFGLQAKLAADLIVDPGFNGNEEQIKALKMGKLSPCLLYRPFEIFLSFWPF